MLSNWSDISFAHPWFFGLLLVPIGIYLWRRIKKVQDKVHLTVPSIEAFKNKKSLRTSLLPLLDILRLLSFVAFVFALARPQITLKEEEINAEGIDIMVAMDVSTSMLATDFNPNRIEVSKTMAMQFVDKREHDRIGLVVFSGEAFTQCPLTTDHKVVKNFLSALRCGMLEDGTAIGMGLASAVNRLKESDAESRIVILLTDGVNNQGYIDPETAADIAQEYGIKVYTIGIGTTGVVKMPNTVNGQQTYGYRRMKAEIDEKLLTEIANKTGGQYFRAQSENALAQVYDYINQLEKTEIEVKSFKRYSEEFRIFLLIGLILLLLEFILKHTALRSLP